MDKSELRRNVTVLQAYVRGFLVRRRFQHLQAEYEGIVQDIEGGLDRLQWTGCFIPRPLFSRSLRGWHSQESVPEKDVVRDTEHLCQHTVKDEAKPRVNADGTQPNQKGNVGSSHQQGLDTDEATGEKADWLHCSSESTGWTRSYSETETRVENTDLLFKQESGDLPHSLPELCQHRKHLTMEMLWLQQAIASRKNYLTLKRRLITPR